jgi:hypothetical protein
MRDSLPLLKHKADEHLRAVIHPSLPLWGLICFRSKNERVHSVCILLSPSEGQVLNLTGEIALVLGMKLDRRRRGIKVEPFAVWSGGEIIVRQLSAYLYGDAGRLRCGTL